MNKSTRDTLGLLSFAALFFFALAFLLSRIGANMHNFAWLGSLLLLIVVIVEAKNYSDHLSNTWQIIFYIIAVVAVIAFVWGFF